MSTEGTVSTRLLRTAHASTSEHDRVFCPVPVAKGHFLLGNTLDFGPNVLESTVSWARNYGDVVRITVPGFQIYQVTHPAFIEKLVITHHRDLRKDWFTRSTREVLGNGLLVNEGEHWKAQRRLIQPAFHHARIRGYAQTMVQFAHAYATSLPEGTVDLHAGMMELTLRIVCRNLFGLEGLSNAPILRDAVELYTQHFAGLLGTRIRFPKWVPTPSNLRWQKAFRAVDALLAQAVEDRRNNPARDDLLSMLIEARDDQGQPLSAQQLRDELVTLFMAGHETSALSLTFALHLLSKHPEVEARLHEEIDAVLNGRTPSFEDLPKLPYTGAVIREAMRLYPPVWTLGRELLHDVELGPHMLPKGALVMLPAWVTHHDDRWFEAPNEFRPERFVGDLERILPKFAYFPFGGGQRLCIGRTFALTESTLALATLAQHISVRSVSNEPLKLTVSATIRPANGLCLQVTRREKSRLA